MPAAKLRENGNEEDVLGGERHSGRDIGSDAPARRRPPASQEGRGDGRHFGGASPARNARRDRRDDCGL